MIVTPISYYLINILSVYNINVYNLNSHEQREEHVEKNYHGLPTRAREGKGTRIS